LDQAHFISPHTGYIDAGNNETILGLVAKGRPMPEMKYTPFVILTEPDTMVGQPFPGALTSFAVIAQRIIAQFDH